MNGPIVKKLSDAQLKVLRGGCRKRTTHRRTSRKWCHTSRKYHSRRCTTRRTTRRCHKKIIVWNPV